MAQAKVINNQLRLEFNDGLTEAGKTRVKSKTFSNLRAEATDDNLLVVGQSIEGLSEKDLHKTKKIVTSEIIG